MFSVPGSLACLIRPHCFKVPLKASLVFKAPCVLFCFVLDFFFGGGDCVIHAKECFVFTSILIYLTAPQRCFYKKGIIN